MLFIILVPVFMPVPVIRTITSSDFNVTWVEPDLIHRRGLINHYSVYNYQANEDPDDIFGPPYNWVVSMCTIMFLVIMMTTMLLNLWSYQGIFNLLTA